MLNENSSLTVANCEFKANNAAFGGGMFNDGGNPTIINQTPFPGLTFTPLVTATSLALRAEGLIPGDADLSGRVDVHDLDALANNWLQSGNWLDGDFDGNGVIDKADLGLMALNWHANVLTAPDFGLPVSTIPEPLSAWAVGLAGILLLRVRNSLES